MLIEQTKQNVKQRDKRNGMAFVIKNYDEAERKNEQILRFSSEISNSRIQSILSTH